MNTYLGDRVCFTILREDGGPRAVGDQFGHDLSGHVGRHRNAGGKERRRGASAEKRIAASTGRIWSNTAANACLLRVPRRPVMA